MSLIEDLELGANATACRNSPFDVMRAVDYGWRYDRVACAGVAAVRAAMALLTYATTRFLALGGRLCDLKAPPAWSKSLVNAPDTPMNLNSPTGLTDLDAGLDALTRELPDCRSVVMVVSWFGSDLRAGACQIEPKVEFPDRGRARLPVVRGRARGGGHAASAVAEWPAGLWWHTCRPLGD